MKFESAIIWAWLIVQAVGVTVGSLHGKKKNWGKHTWAIRNDEGEFNNALKEDLCATLYCHKGEECVMHGRMAMCKCRPWCPTHGTTVCGSNGRTYTSHCELHRQACLTNQRLRVSTVGPCATEKAAKSDKKDTSHQPIKFISMPNTGNLDLSEFMQQEGVPMAQIVAPQIVSFQATLHKHKQEISKLFSPERDNATEKPKASTDPTTVVLNITESTEAPTTEIATETQDAEHCDETDYGFMQNNLLLYFHAKYAEKRDDASEHGKKYLIDLMFQNLDENSDGHLAAAELRSVQNLSKQFRNLLPVGCDLSKIVTFSDFDKDQLVSQDEFLRSYGFPVGILGANDKTIFHTVPYGEQFQLMCGIQVPHGQRVLWQRYDKPLTNIAPNNFEFSKSGASIYLTPATLAHNGNFSCEYRSQHFPTVKQTHVITVVKEPAVRVSPSFLLLKIGETGRLYCDFQGPHALDPARLSWEKNGRYLSHNSTILEFKEATLEQTGSYACTLSSHRGAARAAASVVVREEFQQPERSMRGGQYPDEIFAVFYEGGVRSYNAETCTLERVIPGSYMATDLNRPSLCENYNCEWSDAVRAGNFIYAALCKDKAIAVLDLNNGAVKQILPVDFYPQRLFYIPWKDTVWLETWHDHTGTGRTILVIHSASSDVRHGLTHALPLVTSFDTVSDIFLPSQNAGSSPVLYGYVTHFRDERLHKLDLHKLSVVSVHDLANYNCHPKDLAYLTNVGIVVIYCVNYHTNEPTGQLVIDYLTDVVLEHRGDVYGVPLVAPNSEILVSIDQKTGRIFVQKVVGKSLKLVQTVDELFPLVDWTLFPTDGAVFGYDLYAVSSKVNSIIKICLDSGKIEHLAALPEAEELKNGATNRNIHGKLISTKSQIDGRFLVAKSGKTNASIYDLSDLRNPHCQIGKLPDLSSIIWL